MLADFFTKPLHGTLFKFFKDIIMGYVSIDDLTVDTNGIKEHVGNFGNPPKEDKLIHVGSTGVTKEEHNRQNKGTELYPLGQGQSKKSPRESTGAGSTSTGIKTYAGGKPTYASIISNT